MDETIIFLVLLPVMLFAKGYTFKKGAFMRNLKFIVLFGIIGTFISYIVITMLIYAANYMSKYWVTLRFNPRCKGYHKHSNTIDLVDFVAISLSVQY